MANDFFFHISLICGLGVHSKEIDLSFLFFALSSASAFCVVKTLQKLAQDGGRTIISSIHQPSSEVFELFDNLFLLSGGKTIYFGDIGGAFEVIICVRIMGITKVICINNDLVLFS